jgi:hypothetical protein
MFHNRLNKYGIFNELPVICGHVGYSVRLSVPLSSKKPVTGCATADYVFSQYLFVYPECSGATFLRIAYTSTCLPSNSHLGRTDQRFQYNHLKVFF